MINKCEYCFKEFTHKKKIRFCCSKCQGNNYYHTHPNRKQLMKIYRRKTYLRDFNKNKIRLKEWFKKNRKRQYKNVLNNYYKNKDIWNERNRTRKYKHYILPFINSGCIYCNKNIKILHHKRYVGIPPLRSIKDKKEFFKKYSKNILGFCSKKCHRKYERKFTK